MTELVDYRGKRVVVSGCFSGMGEATARILLDLGAEVHGFDYKDCALPLASFTRVDLRDEQSIDNAVGGLSGSFDALFNCAGLPGNMDLMDVMKVNYLAVRKVTMAMVPKLKDGSGVASISSTSNRRSRATRRKVSIKSPATAPHRASMADRRGSNRSNVVARPSVSGCCRA